MSLRFQLITQFDIPQRINNEFLIYIVPIYIKISFKNDEGPFKTTRVL